jgi:hypothetical protein
VDSSINPPIEGFATALVIFQAFVRCALAVPLLSNFNLLFLVPLKGVLPAKV